ncbi:MAG TPA: VOC family protein [Nitrososphaera sp.]|jgi:PhnB protein
MAKKSRKRAAKKAAKKAKVNHIPKGYHTVTPGLAIRDAARAIEFYKTAFGAKEKTRMPGPDGNTVMHAELQIGDSKIMIGEEMPGMNPSPQALNGSPVGLYLYVRDADKAFSQAVNAGATVTLPMMDQFWGDRAGMITDPFGHKWWLATHKRDLSGKEMKKAAEEFFAQQAKQQ